MKTKLSPNRFYLSNIIFYTCLLAFPSSSAIEQVSQTENSKPSIIGNDNEWLEIDKAESIDEESSPKLTGYEQITALINKLNKENEQLKEKVAEFESMLSIMISIEPKGEDGMTSFLSAVKKGQLGIAKLLKERGANIHAKDKDGNNALHKVCLSGNVKMTTWLLDKCKLGLEAKGYYEKTPFLFAANKGQLAIAKLLRKRGANIHAKSSTGNNALHFSCLYSDSVPTVTWLLDECKIGLETKGRNQRTPFLCAAEKGQLGIAKLLKQRGANIHAKNEYENNALHFACLYSGSEAIVTWLLNVCKLGLETKGYYQKTPFLCAAEKGQLAIAKLLRQRGANINAKNEDGNNALHNACLYSGSVAMVEWLLDVCKLGLETKGYYQKTPFLCAANKGQLAIAKLLRKGGANIHAKSSTGNNALHFACLYSDSVPTVTWLLDECKIGLETKGYYEKTPFLCAAEKGQLAIAKLLKKQDANLNAKDKNGRNALWWAKNNKHKAMINYLEEELGLK